MGYKNHRVFTVNADQGALLLGWVIKTLEYLHLKRARELCYAPPLGSKRNINALRED
jgi:hypothetical protein